MPEGDSVYVLARRLDRIRGQEIERSEFRTPALATSDLSGQTLVENATHGKHLLQRFSGGVTLHSHLRMDGAWTITRPGKSLPSREQFEVRVVLATPIGTAWGSRLHDLAIAATADEASLVGHLGPDPLRTDWDPVEAVRRLGAQAETPLVSALLDQRWMAGLGNLWVNELAFLMGVSPWISIGDLGEARLTRLVTRAATALMHSATVPGAYQVTTGVNRRGQTHWVTGRHRQPCLRCRTPIQVVDELPNDPANRRTWWCPTCQPGPGPEARIR